MIKILIVRLSSLGDIVHTYPMLNDIKKNVKECKVDWLVDESFAELVKLNPLVNNVITVPLRSWKKNKLQIFSNLKSWRQQIGQLKYDYIIDSQGLIKSAFLAKCFTGKIYGLGKYSIREKAATYLYDEKFETGKHLLAITKNRLLAAAIFKYDINTEKVSFGLEQLKFDQLAKHIADNYVIFFHATSKDSKKYPMSAWITVANYLIKHYHLSVILPYGSEKELNESIEIKKLINSVHVIVPDKRYTYTELSGLISNASFVFGVDTGLIHLANALNKKLIAIYIDTDPQKTGIYETDIAKNIGNINTIPPAEQIIKLYEKINQTESSFLIEIILEALTLFKH